MTVHLIPGARFPLRPPFRSAFLRLEDALGHSLDPRQKSIVAEWLADALGGARAREALGFLGLRFDGEQVSNAREALANGGACCARCQ
jgi:hypothetical protein